MRKLFGFGIVEVLISVVIMSVGLLGVAMLQVQSMQVNQASNLKDTAQMLVDEMANRIRANAIEGKKSVSGTTPQTNHFQRTSAVGYIVTTQPTQCAGTASILPGNIACTPEQLADYEIWNWQQMIAKLLPGGQGTVCSASTTTTPVPNSGVPPCNDALTNASMGALSPLVVIVWWNRPKLNENISSNTQNTFSSIIQRVDI